MRYVARQPPEEANVAPGSPLVELAQLVVGGVVAVGVLVLVAGWLVDRAVVFLPRDLEHRGFGPIVAELAFAQAPDEAVRARLDGLLQRLGSTEEVTLGVLDESDPNAFAVPGGGILVTRGLLDSADDEELAFVLGHELAHLEHRDGLRALGRGVLLAVALSLVGAGGAASPLELGEVTGKLALQSFGRGQELRADASAVDRLEQGGFGTAGAVRLLERFGAREGAGLEAVAWASTHPLSRARIEAIRGRQGDSMTR
jgi:Zn-dependent protease with chaperone function